MSVVTVSPKFQVVIPLAIREALGLAPGQKVQALQYLDRIEFIPAPSRPPRPLHRGRREARFGGPPTTPTGS